MAGKDAINDIDDVDDDLFISKRPQNYIFADKKINDITERTNKSLLNSRKLIQESEQHGQSTLEMLSSQRETLERVENDLDNINSMTRYTQKQLKNMRSFFGGIKSIFSSTDQNANAPPSITNTRQGIPRSATTSNVPSGSSTQAPAPVAASQRGSLASSSSLRQPVMSEPADEFEANLSEIGFGLGRLKEMAMNLGNEIGDQNEMLDRITNKSERAGDSIVHQNRQIQQILKKG